MNSQQKRFWNAITILNLFFSTMICLYHNNGYVFYDDGSLSKSVKNVIDISQNGFLANISVPLFMFLSAFLFYRNIDWDRIKEKMLTRVRSLVIPYVCWNAITGGAVFLMQSIPFIRSKMAVREMALFDPISVVKGLTITPYDGVLWTVLQLILFTAIAPVIYTLLKNKYVGIIALIGAFLIGTTEWNIPLLVHGNGHLFTYLFGAYVGLHWYQKVLAYEYKYVHYIVSLLIVALLCVLYEFDVYNVLCQIVGMFALYILANYIAGYVEECSKICYGLSFWIYAIHDWLEPCIMKLWFMFGIKGNSGALFSTFAGAAVTIALCVSCAKICKKMTPKVYSILSGGRG